MTISWFGLSSFKITGKDLTIITDPFGKETGLSPVRGAADVVICSNIKNISCNNLSSISGEPFVVNGPGEFDIKNAFIIGVAAEGPNNTGSTIYSIEVENIRIAFLGPVKQNQLSEVQMEAFEGADIALIPVGGKEMMDFEQAGKISTQLEPFIVIPHSYKISGINLNLEKMDKFVQEMGGKFEEMEKLTLKKKDLVDEATKLIVLTPQR